MYVTCGSLGMHPAVTPSFVWRLTPHSDSQLSTAHHYLTGALTLITETLPAFLFDVDRTFGFTIAGDFWAGSTSGPTSPARSAPPAQS